MGSTSIESKARLTKLLVRRGRPAKLEIIMRSRPRAASRKQKARPRWRRAKRRMPSERSWRRPEQLSEPIDEYSDLSRCGGIRVGGISGVRIGASRPPSSMLSDRQASLHLWNARPTSPTSLWIWKPCSNHGRYKGWRRSSEDGRRGRGVHSSQGSDWKARPLRISSWRERYSASDLCYRTMR